MRLGSQDSGSHGDEGRTVVTAKQDRGHAVVLGASMAGLLSARVLSDHFDRVTLIEKDRFPPSVDNRQGVPQGQHAHGLLSSGFRVMTSLFPGLAKGLTHVSANTHVFMVT